MIKAGVLTNCLSLVADVFCGLRNASRWRKQCKHWDKNSWVQQVVFLVW